MQADYHQQPHCTGFGRRLSWTDEGVVPEGHKMTFHQAMNVILTDYLYKLILPGWVLNLTTKFRQVRDGFDEIRVCVYILRQ